MVMFGLQGCNGSPNVINDASVLEVSKSNNEYAITIQTPDGRSIQASCPAGSCLAFTMPDGTIVSIGVAKVESPASALAAAPSENQTPNVTADNPVRDSALTKDRRGRFTAENAERQLPKLRQLWQEEYGSSIAEEAGTSLSTVVRLVDEVYPDGCDESRAVFNGFYLARSEPYAAYARKFVVVGSSSSFARRNTPMTVNRGAALIAATRFSQKFELENQFSQPIYIYSDPKGLLLREPSETAQQKNRGSAATASYDDDEQNAIWSINGTIKRGGPRRTLYLDPKVFSQNAGDSVNEMGTVYFSFN